MNRIERLRHWKRVTLRLPKKVKYFDMSDYAYERECGTAACSLGAAGFSPRFQALGLKTIETGFVTYVDPKTNKRSMSLYAAVHFFNITESEAESVIAPSKYQTNDVENITQQMAADRIQILIDKYSQIEA